jgi:hypothetical protein
MRLHRGTHIVTGKTIYGHPVKLKDSVKGTTRILLFPEDTSTHPIDTCFSEFWDEHNSNCLEIIPDSLAEFTGYKDVDNEPIYSDAKLSGYYGEDGAIEKPALLDSLFIQKNSNLGYSIVDSSYATLFELTGSQGNGACYKRYENLEKVWYMKLQDLKIVKD